HRRGDSRGDLLSPLPQQGRRPGDRHGEPGHQADRDHPRRAPRMNFRRSHAREDPDINLIPLIDILIVILIFLFLTTTYSRFAELQINLPQAAADRANEKPDMLMIAVDANGKYAINGITTNYSDPQQFAGALHDAA